VVKWQGKEVKEVEQGSYCFGTEFLYY